MKKKVRGGRPPKFNEERSPITVTLPLRILQKLKTIDPDRAKAIVKCVDTVVQQLWTDEQRVEVVEIEKGAGLLVVGPSQRLRSIPWLKLIEITPFRYLLAVPTGTAIDSLEIAIIDLIEHLPENDIAEKSLLMDLRQKISHHRRKEGLTKGEILYISTE
jgi:hypothetical protein